MSVKIKATEIIAKDLLPGDLFSTVGPSYWDQAMDSGGIGERVYIRTNRQSDIAPDDGETVYKIEVLRGGEDGDAAGGR